jgi:hypothetical protein
VTLVNLLASYNTLESTTLTINPVVLSSLSLNPADVSGGNSSTGTAVLSGPAPPGGAVVTLSSEDPMTAGILGVHSPGGLPQDGSINWLDLWPANSSLASGTTVPVTGLSGLHATVSTAASLPLDILTNCPGEGCGWVGNFAPGTPLLWVGGTYASQTGWWAPNGPLTIAFDSPQHGLGFQIMADESGAFTAKLCAYNGNGDLLSCVPFDGNGTANPDGSAVFVGLYDDVAEISKVTIDAGGIMYPHDFAISNLIVAGIRMTRVPASVTVTEGAATGSFPVDTIAAGAPATMNITGSYVVTDTAALQIHPPGLAAISLSQSSLSAGESTTGTATLSGPAPAGGAVVTLSSDDAPVPGVQSVSGSSDISHDGIVVWTDAGASLTQIASGTSLPVTGQTSLSVTVTTASGLPPTILTNCPAVKDCGWDGDFVPAAPLLWTGGKYDATGAWIGNGPLTLTLSSPRRGVGFQIMAKEAGPFNGTVCAYGTGGGLLGCIPFSSSSHAYPDGTAAYVGVYDDAAEISAVTIDASGSLYPHDFAIGNLTIASTRRTVPASVTVPAGATSANFPVNTGTGSPSELTVSGTYGVSQQATLTVLP